MRRLVLLAFITIGCYFKGHEGYICESTKDCESPLVCRSFSRGSDTRNACVPPGTSSIGSKSTYTEFAVYAAWIATFLIPIAFVASYVIEGRKKKRAA